MKLLVGTANSLQFRYYQDLLKNAGFIFLHARSGPEVLELAGRDQPDLFLLDRDLPDMDGFETALRLRTLAGSVFTPILFVSRDSNPQDLARLYLAGASDVVMKPIDANLFAAKISAQRRTRAQNEEIHRDRDELKLARRLREKEEALASRILERAQGESLPDAARLQQFFRPMTDFSGDLLLGAMSPRNSLYLLIGDATGHGLSAAISAMPVARIFHAMARKGLNIGDIAQELNRDLLGLLPDDMFVAATLVEINQQGTRMTAWSGGMPDIWKFSANGTHTAYSSQHMPLGAEEDEDFERDIQIIPLAEGDRVYFQTDGIMESFSPDGELFGEERLLELVRGLQQETEAAARFDRIRGEVEAHMQGAPQEDDITLLELTAAPLATDAAGDTPQVTGLMVPWSIDIRMDGDAMRRTDPVLQLIEMMGESPGFSGHKDILFTILSEMYTNALDHGVLGLDSALKRDEDGFVLYYAEKESRLDALEAGEVHIHCAFRPRGDGGELLMRMRDSGAGFAYQRVLAQDPDDDLTHGRGLALIRTLCEHMAYSDGGRCLEVIYPMVFS